jgi:hypothetical protein
MEALKWWEKFPVSSHTVGVLNSSLCKVDSLSVRTCRSALAVLILLAGILYLYAPSSRLLENESNKTVIKAVLHEGSFINLARFKILLTSARQESCKHAPRNNTVEVFSLCPPMDRCYATRVMTSYKSGKLSRENPNSNARNNGITVFSVRSPCREDVRVRVVQSSVNIRGLSLAAAKHTTVQVSRLPL